MQLSNGLILKINNDNKIFELISSDEMNKT